MFPAALSDRLDALIDELIMDGGVEAASLASILLTAKDSIKRDDHVTLSRKVWAANNELLDDPASSQPLSSRPSGVIANQPAPSSPDSARPA